MESIVKTEQLTKRYGGLLKRRKITALEKLSVEVNQGEIFGLVGPNGSGKTTALKLLLGLIFPTSGKAFVFGKKPRDVNIKKKIGYLPEEPCFYEYLNAKELLDFYGRLYGMGKEERRKRIDVLLELVGLKEASGRILRGFSKGMLQRTGLAQAMINDPELLILDEPTSGLDPIGSKEIRDLIVGLKKKGKTIILCSHLLSEVESICDRIGILFEGRLIKLGSIDELLLLKEVEISAENLSDQTIEGIKGSGGAVTKTDSVFKINTENIEGALHIANLIKENNGKLISLYHKRESLEELFMRVVKEEAS